MYRFLGCINPRRRFKVRLGLAIASITFTFSLLLSLIIGNSYNLETRPDGIHYIASFDPSVGQMDDPRGERVVRVEQKADIAKAQARELQQNILVWGAVLSAVSGALSSLSAGSIVDRLVALRAASESIRLGDTTVSIPVWEGTDEIAILSESLRNLVDTLNEQKQSLQYLNQELLIDVAKRKEAEAQVRLLNAELEQRVTQRTAKLRRIVAQLTRQIDYRKRAAAELREAQAFLKAVVDNLPIMVFVKDARDLRFVLWNKTSEQLLNHSNEEMIGKTDYDFWIEEHADFFTAKDREVLAKGTLLDIPAEPLQTSHKGLRILHTKKIPIFDAAGNPQYLLGICEDITEQLRSQQRVAAQYAANRIMSESATLESALPKILQAICESLEWDVGEFWMVEAESPRQKHRIARSHYTDLCNADKLKDCDRSIAPHRFVQRKPRSTRGLSFGVSGFESVSCGCEVQSDSPPLHHYLRCVEIWHSPSLAIPEFIAIAKEITFAPGMGLPGRVWLSGEPAWISDLVEDTNFEHYATAAKEGLHGCFGFPIRYGESVLGVMTFSSRFVQQFDPDLVQMMATIGSQLGQFIQRQQAEEALRQSEKRFRSLVANLPGAVYRCACDADWTMAFLSEAAADISGYPSEDFINNRVRTFASIIHPDDTSFVERIVREAVAARLPYTREYRIIRADGSIRWVYEKGQGMYAEDGSLICLDGVIFDISDRKQAEGELAAASAQIANILESIADAFFAVDRQWKVTYMNAEAERVLHKTSEQVVGKNLWEEFPEAIGSTFYNQYHRALSEGRVVTFEEFSPQLDTWFEVRAYPSEEGLSVYFNDINSRKQAEEVIRKEQEKVEGLLLNILPKPIVERLKQEQSIIADRFEEATILFCDIVGFTQLSSRISPTELVYLLNKIFSSFDELTERYGLEKIKTIGDAYMVVGGLPTPGEDRAEAIAEMALDMQKQIRRLSVELGEALNVRIGINTGPVVAGVIGTKKFIYDLWGDAVNIASRMESQGIPGTIQVTASTYELLCGKYQFEKRGVIQVKGKGEMLTYLLTGRCARFPAS